MAEYEVWPTGHEVELIIVRSCDKHERDVLGGRMGHLGRREFFVTRNLVRLSQRCKKIDEEHIDSLGLIQRRNPIVGDDKVVRRVKPLAGSLLHLALLGNQK